MCLCIYMSLQKCRLRSVVEFNLVFLVSSVDNSVANVVYNLLEISSCSKVSSFP